MRRAWAPDMGAHVRTDPAPDRISQRVRGAAEQRGPAAGTRSAAGRQQRGANAPHSGKGETDEPQRAARRRRICSMPAEGVWGAASM